MINDFAMTLKPEMSGLYNPGVYRANGHFVDLFAFHFEVTVPWTDLLLVVTLIEIMHANGLKPWMSLRLYAELLIYFTFEQVYLGATRRQ
jgi:hypothetical protein